MPESNTCSIFAYRPFINFKYFKVSFDFCLSREEFIKDGRSRIAFTMPLAITTDLCFESIIEKAFTPMNTYLLHLSNCSLTWFKCN